MAIRALIRDDKVHQIYSQMQMGQDKFGMQTMNQALFMLYHTKKDLAWKWPCPAPRIPKS